MGKSGTSHLLSYSLEKTSTCVWQNGDRFPIQNIGSPYKTLSRGAGATTRPSKSGFLRSCSLEKAPTTRKIGGTELESESRSWKREPGSLLVRQSL